MRTRRRTYDKDGTEFPLMTLASLRDHGPPNVMVECHACKREVSLNVDGLPGDTFLVEGRRTEFHSASDKPAFLSYAQRSRMKWA